MGAGMRQGGSAKSQIALKASFSSAGPRRHRYVQDGEVPVVQVSSMRDRRPAVAAPVPHEPPTDAIRQMLAQERSARLRAEQTLERVQASLHAVETRLGHAEIIQRESAQLASTHEANVRRLEAELSEQVAATRAARQEVEAAVARHRALQNQLDILRSGVVEEDAEPPAKEPPPLRRVGPRVMAPRAVARPATPELALGDQNEPEPVKWWLTPISKTKARRGG